MGGGDAMRLPEIRERLIEIAREHDIDELLELADEIPRRNGSKRGPVRSRKMTPELAEEIRIFVRENPNMRQFDVAKVFNVNQGRVSEALIGKRD